MLVRPENLKRTVRQISGLSNRELRTAWSEGLHKFSLGEADALDRLLRILVRRELVRRFGSEHWNPWS